MATRLVTFYSCHGPICNQSLPAETVLIVPWEKVAKKVCPDESSFQYSYVEGQLVTQCRQVNAGLVQWQYDFSFDDDQLNPGYSINGGDVIAAFCKAGPAQYADERAGDEVSIVEDEAGLQTLVTQHGCEYPIDPPILNSSLVGVDDVTTDQVAYSVISGMAVTPIAGLYLATFSASGGIDDAEALGNYAIFVAGLIEQHSEKDFSLQNVAALGSLHTQAIVSVDGNQQIDVQYKTSAGVFTVKERSLLLVKLA